MEVKLCAFISILVSFVAHMTSIHVDNNFLPLKVHLITSVLELIFRLRDHAIVELIDYFSTYPFS